MSEVLRFMEMTEGERLMAAQNLEEPDCVPYYLAFEPEFFAGYCGMDLREYWMDIDKMVEAQRVVQERFLGEMKYVSSYFTSYAEATSLGAKVVFPENSLPVLVETEPVVKTIEDAERLEVADPFKDGLMPLIIKTHQKLKRKVGDKFHVSLGSGAQGPFTTAALLIGQYRIFVEVYRNPELVHKVLEVTTSNAINWIKTKKEIDEAPWEGSGLSDDLGGFLPPRLYEEFVFPYNNKVFETFGGLRHLHSESITEKHLDIIKRYRLTSFGPDTRMQHIDIPTLKRHLGDDMCILGFVDEVTTMMHGTPQDVEDAVKRAIAEGAPGGGFRLGVDLCAWPIPPENVDAFLRAVKKYGRYPNVAC